MKRSKFFRILIHSIKALLNQKVKTILMMLGTAIGIMLLSGVMGLSKGVELRIEEVMKFFGPRSGVIFSGGGRLQTASGRASSPSVLKLKDVETLRNNLGEKAIFSAVIRREGIQVKYEDQIFDTTIFSSDPDFLATFEWFTKEGEPIDFTDEKIIGRVCLLGSTVAKNLFFDENPIGKKILINKIPFKVKGILQEKGTSPMGQDMDDCIWIPLSTGMKRVFNIDYIRAIRFKVREGYDLLKVRDEIAENLRKLHRIKEGEEEDFQIRTPERIAERIKEMTKTARMVGFALSIVALIVGGIVLMNILLLSVSERVPEIGLKRAIGAKERDIFLEFLMESISVSFFGMLLGVLLGFIPVNLLPKFLPDLPMAFSLKAFTYGIIFSFLVGLFFGVQPARKASKLTPIEALR
jgi:putative ABC transport system permease protein